MFCPKCGQQQVSEEARYCSRCGLQLSAVPELIAHDGVLPVYAEPRSLTPRQKGMRFGAKLTFASFVITPVFLGLSFIFDNPLPLFVPFTLFVAGLVWLFYSRLFGENYPAVSGAGKKSKLGAPTRVPALPPPPARSVFDGVNATRPGTQEIQQPPSITENTTKLLKDS